MTADPEGHQLEEGGALPCPRPVDRLAGLPIDREQVVAVDAHARHAIGPRLDLRQSQSLVMTPQLQQAIKLLALSNLEIEGFIAEELEKNPLLEAALSEVLPLFPAFPY